MVAWDQTGTAKAKVKVVAMERIVAGSFARPTQRAPFRVSKEKTPTAVAAERPVERLIFHEPLPKGKRWLKSPA